MKLSVKSAKDFDTAYESQLKNEKLPITVSYKLAKISKKIKEDLEFYTNKLQEILKEYAEFDENGQIIYIDNNFIKIKDGKIEECQEKINELENLIIEIDYSPLSIDDLGNIEMSADTLEKLLPILE